MIEHNVNNVSKNHMENKKFRKQALLMRSENVQEEIIQTLEKRTSKNTCISKILNFLPLTVGLMRNFCKHKK